LREAYPVAILPLWANHIADFFSNAVTFVH
jgi:hypothetical protein